MVKVKYNDIKETYSLKGLSYENMQVIQGILNQTVLGSDTYPNAAYEILQAIETEGFEPCEVGFTFGDDGYFELRVS